MNTPGYYCVQVRPPVSSVGSEDGHIVSPHVRDYLWSLRGGHSARTSIKLFGGVGLTAGKSLYQEGLASDSCTEMDNTDATRFLFFKALCVGEGQGRRQRQGEIKRIL